MVHDQQQADAIQSSQQLPSIPLASLTSPLVMHVMHVGKQLNKRHPLYYLYNTTTWFHIHFFFNGTNCTTWETNCFTT